MSASFSLDIIQKEILQVLYCMVPKDLLNEEAIFSDETYNFRIPSEPSSNDSVEVLLRTARNNVEEVYLHYGNHAEKLSVKYSDEMFDFYSGIIPPQKDIVHYYFDIRKDGLVRYCNKQGVTSWHDPKFDFNYIPDFKTPDWAKGAVMYQIFVDRFYNGNPTNDIKTAEYIYEGKPVEKIEDWYKYPAADGIREFYGGDLQGVIEKMGYLQDLGIEVIYFNPIFVSPSNHKYDTQDYDYVDPHFGVIVKDGGEVLKDGKYDNRYATMYIQRTTDKENLEASNQLMITLIEVAHQHGIKVILDGVFNHCGSFNKWLDREGFYERSGAYSMGAYRSKESPYLNYFHWYERDNWPNNDCYDGWWGHGTLPKLNYEGSKALYNHILDVARKWVSPPFNADGWRLDVAADLGYSKEFNHQFWKDFREAVKEANPNAIILAEHYGDPYEWLRGSQWDTVMNYDAFMEPVTWFFTGMQKHSDDFRPDLLGNADAFEGAMNYHMSRLTVGSLQVAMNQLSNHDHSRFLTRTNMIIGRTHTKGPAAASTGINKGIFKEAVVMQMTWPGAPTLYYGDEAGVCGWTDPDNRRTYPWGREDVELVSFHKSIINIHKSYQALKTGSVLVLYKHNANKLLSFGRWDQKDKFVAAFNNDNREHTLEIPVWRIGTQLNGKMQRLIQTDPGSFTVEVQELNIENGKVVITLPPYCSILLREV